MRRTLGPVALLLTGCLMGGCAAGRGGTLTGRFVRPGEPAVDYGGPPPATAESLQLHLQQLRHLAESATPRASSFGATIEGSDARLAAALLAEAMLPSAERHVQVAEEYRRLGILDAAHARLNRAIALEPRLARAHELQAQIWRDWRLPELGLGAAYRAVSYAPGSASAYNTLGTLLEKMGRPNDARWAYQRALVRDPQAAWVLNNLCHLDLQRGRLAQARAQCEQAVALSPDLVAAHNNLALVHAAAGDFARARDVLLAAHDAATAQYNLGIVHLAARDYAAAAAAFEEAIEARPDFSAAKARARDARQRALTESH